MMLRLWHRMWGCPGPLDFGKCRTCGRKAFHWKGKYENRWKPTHPPIATFK